MNDKQLLLNALYDKAKLASREDFLTFIKFMDPGFCEGRHHQIIAEKLEAVERGDITRLMVFMPPRSGKSYMISQYFPAWYMGRNERQQLLSISYGIDLAENWGNFVRNTIQSKEYQEVFPKVQIRADKRASIRWATNNGGIYNAAGVTGRIAGKGAHLGIIDDPLNEQDAYSKAARDHVIRWWPAGFRSRLMPDGRVILLMTRWHEDDLAGHLLAQANRGKEFEQWEVLSIPALLDEEGSKLLGYPKDTSFWPVPQDPPAMAPLTGWPTKSLKQTKIELPPDQWQAVYQQKPSSDEGNILKKDWWKDWVYPDPPQCHYIFLSLDTAFSEKDSADFSAITTWGVYEDEETGKNNLILLGAKKGRWDFPTLREMTAERFSKFMADNIIIEDKASGQSLVQDLVKIGYPCHPFKVDRDKEARAHAITSLFWSGRIWAPKSKKWARDVIEECALFPKGKYKDYVDCTTQACQWVRDSIMVIAKSEPWHDEDEGEYVPYKRRAQNAYNL